MTVYMIFYEFKPNKIHIKILHISRECNIYNVNINNT